MKRNFYLLLLFSLFSARMANGQSSFRFADSTAQWNVIESYIYEGVGGVDSTFICTVAGDTVVNGIQYQKIITPAELHDGHVQTAIILVRRDSLNNIFVRGNDSVDYLTYKFNVQVGDTFTIDNELPVMVSAVDTVTLGTPRTRVTLCWRQDTVCQGGPALVCVDGIGTEWGNFLWPGTSILIGDGGFVTNCYFQNGTLLYHDTSFTDCIIDTIYTNIPQPILEEPQVFPTLVTENHVMVVFRENPGLPAQMKLYDVTGRVVLQNTLSALSNPVYLANISRGVYFYSIISQQQKVSSGKLVVE